MTANLIPTPIVDKNGKRTTVRKKPVSITAAAKPLPAPAPLPAFYDYVPTADQFAPKTIEVIQAYDRMDEYLAEITAPIHGAYGWHKMKYEANDVEVYDVLSVTSIGNANALLHAGVRSRDEAIQFLTENDFAHSIVDNSAIVEAALRRGLSAKHYVDFCNEHHTSGIDPEIIIDAADIHGRSSYNKVPIRASISMRILDGEISAADVKTIGSQILSDSNDLRIILGRLASIKRGEQPYDAQQLRSYFDATSHQIGYAAAISLADRIGMDRVLPLHDKLFAVQQADNITNFFKFPQESLYDALLFFDAFDPKPQIHMLGDELRACTAGVKPEAAARLRGKGMSVDDIISAHEAGISSAIAEGWI